MILDRLTSQIKSKTVQDGKIAIIEIRGELLGHNLTQEFRRQIDDFIEQGNKSLIINLQKVLYINSSGLGAIIAASEAYIKMSGKVRLVGPNKNIQNLLAVTRLAGIFDFYETVEEAIKSFSKEQSKNQVILLNNLQE